MTGSKKNNKNKTRPRRKKTRKNSLRKKLVLTLVLLFVAVIGTATFFYNYVGKFSKKYGVEDRVVKNADEPVNILFAGLDIGDPNQKSSDDIKRTDTLIVMHFAPKTKKLILISIPRDTLITFKGKNHKINEAYTIGGEKFLKSSVEKIIDKPIDYMVKINYEGFRSFIDAIGGIEMYIERDMYYDDPGQNLHIDFKKGETVLLDGEKAEEFFRWRKNNDGTGLEDGDIGRIKNQQLFISKVIEKCTSPSIVLKVKDILDVLPKFIETNMPTNKIINYGLALTSLKSENINMYTIQGENKYIDNISYVIYDKKSNLDILNKLDDNVNLEAENKIKSLKIKVLNATKIEGLASECANVLREYGYSDIEIGNFEESEKSYIEVNNKELKKTLKKELGIKKTVKLRYDEKNYHAIIILGKDYIKFGE